MNRQQRRAAERQAEKDGKQFREVLKMDPRQRGKYESVIRASFRDGQIYNNHDWAIRLERIFDVKGIGPKLISKIFKVLEEPLTPEEREKARKQYENGGDHIDFGNQKPN